MTPKNPDYIGDVDSILAPGLYDVFSPKLKIDNTGQFSPEQSQ